MQHPSRKAVLSIAAVSSVAVVIAAGIVFRRPVLEHWYLQKLESGVTVRLVKSQG